MRQKKINFELETAVIVVPACIVYRGKNCYLNMNTFSNWHYQKKGAIKKKFTNSVFHKLMLLPKMAKIHSLTYTIIRTNHKKRDRMNVYSIVDKFFCDALQVHEIIEDDSDDFIGEFNFTKTEYIKGDANQLRVRITIYFEKK